MEANHEAIYQYGGRIMEKFPDLAQRFRAGMVVPDQVEVQLPPRTKTLCWLACPHCYCETGVRHDRPVLSTDRLTALITEIAQGHPATGEMPEKVILGGVNTDPLNSHSAEPVLQSARGRGFVVGIHTKLLVVPKTLARTIADTSRAGDYLSVSVDAGSDATFNSVHGVRNHRAPLYTLVLENIGRVARWRAELGSCLSITATYLLTRDNCRPAEVTRFVNDVFAAGVDYVRFSLPIVPARYLETDRQPCFPTPDPMKVGLARRRIEKLMLRFSGRVCYMDAPTKAAKVVPCFSRWLQPVVGYDGFLYPCCQTASGLFAELRVADLREEGFWHAYLKRQALNVEAAACLCDRKAADLNRCVKTGLGAISRDDCGTHADLA
jgi:MoaA/NifB/PqqE/SkfB family radical SAM enzyme